VGGILEESETRSLPWSAVAYQTHSASRQTTSANRPLLSLAVAGELEEVLMDALID
jgi:hypothetical protein